MNNKITFDEIFQQNKRRIHYHIHKLNALDPQNELFQEGLIAMWKAYETYQPDKGPMATYFNHMIRYRLIDHIRAESRYAKAKRRAIQEGKTQLTDGNHHRRANETPHPLVGECHFHLSDPGLWKPIKSQLTDKQWKWMRYYIIEGLSYIEIAKQENTTVDAVKSWGRQTRKKLRAPEFQKAVDWGDFL